MDLRKGIKNIVVVVAACWLVSCTEKSDKPPGGIAHVIVIGVDGLSPDGIRQAPTPVLDSLIAAGAVKWKARTVLTSASSQNWASMLMGAGPEVHGIIDNDWEIDNHALPPVVSEKDGRFPTIFSLLKAKHPDAETGSVYHWSGFGRLYQKEAVDFDRNLKTEDSTTAVFADYIRASKPVLGFMHLDHVDHAGHHYGHGTAGYYASVAKTDSLVGQIVDALHDAGMAGSTLLMIVSDHGGIGQGHGGFTPQETEVPLILSGPGIRKGYEIQQLVMVYDYGATIAYALGLQPPYEWTGRPVKAAFEGITEPGNNWKGFRSLPAPVIKPEAQQNRKAGGLYIDTQAEVKINPDDARHQVRYTLDGTLPDTTSRVYSQPFMLDKSAVVKARSFDPEGNASEVSTAYFRVVKSGPDQGVKLTFYALTDAEKLPVFKSLKKGPTWTEPEIATTQEKILPLLSGNSQSFGIVAEGYLEINEPGKYHFFTQSDDGSKLFINEKEVVDNDGSHAIVEKSGSIELAAGRQALRVEYFNGVGSGWLEAYYQGPGVPKQLIPADKLFLSR